MAGRTTLKGITKNQIKPKREKIKPNKDPTKKSDESNGESAPRKNGLDERASTKDMDTTQGKNQGKGPGGKR